MWVGWGAQWLDGVKEGRIAYAGIARWYHPSKNRWLMIGLYRYFEASSVCLEVMRPHHPLREAEESSLLILLSPLSSRSASTNKGMRTQMERGNAVATSMISSRTESTPTDCEGFDCQSDKEAPRSLCLSCGSTYCDVCWDRQGPHKPGKVGQDGLPHEKTDKEIYDRLKVIFEPPEGREELSRLHIADEDTTWFAVEKDTSGQPIFQDYGRYSVILSETKQPNSGIRYPQLVSFVGQTGESSFQVKVVFSILTVLIRSWKKLINQNACIFERAEPVVQFEFTFQEPCCWIRKE